MLKEKWTESEIKALPKGEHDYFERKSGDLIEQTFFRDKMSIAVSALANSGGGHILLGVRDDGTFDGVPPTRKNTPTREFLEQIIPNLVDYPLATFRVHEVIPSEETEIPQGKIIIVIDIGDSPHAPHQTKHNKTYYYRPGGKSEPAPHFFLEALRNRAIAPVLEAHPLGVQTLLAHTHDDGLFLQLQVVFEVANKGKNIANRWGVFFECENKDLIQNGVFRTNNFPEGSIRFNIDSLFANNKPLFPTLVDTTFTVFGLNIKPDKLDAENIQHAINSILHNNLAIMYSVVGENGRHDSYVLDANFLQRWLTSKNVLWALANSDNSRSLYGGYGLYCENLSITGKGSTFVDFNCHIRNESSNDYRGLQLVFYFRNHKNRIIGAETITIDFLPSGHALPQDFSARTNIIKGATSYHFCFMGQDSKHSPHYYTLLPEPI